MLRLDTELLRHRGELRTAQRLGDLCATHRQVRAGTDPALDQIPQPALLQLRQQSIKAAVGSPHCTAQLLADLIEYSHVLLPLFGWIGAASVSRYSVPGS